MKNILILFALLGTFSYAVGQSKNDPTYSIHNYKQPNKAEEAKLIKKEGVDNDSYKMEENVASRNYKAQNNDLTANSGAAMKSAPVENNNNTLASTGHYKSAFGKSSRTQSSNNNDSYSSPVVKNKRDGLPKNQ